MYPVGALKNSETFHSSLYHGVINKSWGNELGIQAGLIETQELVKPLRDNAWKLFATFLLNTKTAYTIIHVWTAQVSEAEWMNQKVLLANLRKYEKQPNNNL